MGKIILIHDHTFSLYKGNYYTSASLNEKLLSYYKSFGNEIHIIARKVDIDYFDEKLSLSSGDRIFFHCVGNIRSFSGVKEIPSLVKLVRTICSDADIIFMKLPSTISYISFFALFKYRYKIISEVIGNAKEANLLHGNKLGILASIVEHSITKFVIKNSKNTVYITKKYLQKIYPTNGMSVVCPNAYITPVCYDEELHSPRERKIGLIGSLNVNYKGHDIALYVLKELIKKHPTWKLYFAGGGDKSRWESLAKKLNILDNVEFLGAVKAGDGIFSFIDSMSIMLQPSKVEAQGRCIVEAMSRCKPVVATKIGGIPELINNCRLFSSEDIKEIASEIENIYEDKQYYKDIITEQLKILEDFEEEKIKSRRKIFVERVKNG